MINKLQKFYQNHKELLLSLVVIAIFVVLDMSDAWADSGAENEKGETSTVIGKVRERAIIVIEHIKAIAYIMGGFGLIGLAWGAIFGKINWKWFGSLAIGLFIISWMGMTIDYFTRRGDAGIVASKFKTTGPSDVGCKGDCFGDKAAGLLGGAAVSDADSDADDLTPEEKAAIEEAMQQENDRQQWCADNVKACSQCKGNEENTAEGQENTDSTICKECDDKKCNESVHIADVTFDEEEEEPEEEITFDCQYLKEMWQKAYNEGKQNEADAWFRKAQAQKCEGLSYKFITEQYHRFAGKCEKLEESADYVACLTKQKGAYDKVCYLDRSTDAAKREVCLGILKEIYGNNCENKYVEENANLNKQCNKIGKEIGKSEKKLKDRQDDELEDQIDEAKSAAKEADGYAKSAANAAKKAAEYAGKMECSAASSASSSASSAATTADNAAKSANEAYASAQKAKTASDAKGYVMSAKEGAKNALRAKNSAEGARDNAKEAYKSCKEQEDRRKEECKRNEECQNYKNQCDNGGSSSVCKKYQKCHDEGYPKSGLNCS